MRRDEPPAPRPRRRIADRAGPSGRGDDPRKLAGRSAGWLLILAGAVTAANQALTDYAMSRPGVVYAVSAAAIAVGGACMALPWQRWPSRSTLAVVLVALVLLVVGQTFGNPDPYTYAVYFVVIYAWVGAAHPPGTSLALAPVVGVAYVLPFLLGDEHLPGAPWSAIVAMPVCVLVGEMISRALEGQRRARERDARRAAYLEALVQAGTRLQAEDDRPRVGTAVARAATELLDARGASVYLVDGSHELILTGAHGLYPDRAEKELLAASPVASAVRSAAASRAHPSVRVSIEIEAVPGHEDLIVALQGPSRALGVLVVRAVAGAGAVDDSVCHIARLFAGQAAVAMEQLEVIDALVDAAITDALTGIGNRRHATTLLEGLWPGDGLMLLDLDHFKNVNDALGHDEGDRVLTALAAHLRAIVRDGDDIARYGGEEFLVVLRRADGAVGDVARRLLEGWRRTEPLATFSAGVAIHRLADAPAATLGRADAALYDAKRSGRDRVIVCDERAPEGTAVS